MVFWNPISSVQFTSVQFSSVQFSSVQCSIFLPFGRGCSTKHWKCTWNVNLSSNSHISANLQHGKTGLKHDAVYKRCVFWSFLACQNGPETWSSPQIITFLQICSMEKRAWNTMLSSKTAFVDTFWHFKIGLKREALLKLTFLQISEFFDAFWHAKIGLKREVLVKFVHFCKFAAWQNGREHYACMCIYEGRTAKSPWFFETLSVQFSSVQFSSVQFSSVQFSSVQFSQVQFSSVLCSVREAVLKSLTFLQICSMAKQAWNTMLSTKDASFDAFWHIKMGLKHETLLKLSLSAKV